MLTRKKLLMGGLARTEARAEYRQFVTFANMQKLNKFLSTAISSIGPKHSFVIGRVRRRFINPESAEKPIYSHEVANALDPMWKHGVVMRYFHQLFFSTKEKMKTNLLVENKRSEMDRHADPGSLFHFIDLLQDTYKYILNRTYVDLLDNLSNAGMNHSYYH